MTNRAPGGFSPPARLALALPKSLILGGFFWALLAVIGASFVSEGTISLSLYRELLGSSVMQSIIWRTIWIAATVTVLCAIIAYPLAQYIARSRYSNIMLVAVISPWLTSIVVRSFAWVVILGNKGGLNAVLMSIGLLDTPLRIMFTPTAVVIGLVHVFLPFMVISILAVLQQQDKALTEASMSLGAGRFETFWRVVFPLSLPGVLSGSSIIYMLCSGAIVTPLLLGGVRDKMLGTQIYQELAELYDYKRAAAIAVVLLATSLLIIIPIQMLDGRMRRRMRG
ncbi:ABC transporter permease [Rhodoligotrophos ferricapiens]|uniref:ABC transporter permease n=1 Tax=Rhodoligotrophos ferricapiens TaxID=3069264 RepID=UPI00315CB558